MPSIFYHYCICNFELALKLRTAQNYVAPDEKRTMLGSNKTLKLSKLPQEIRVITTKATTTTTAIALLVMMVMLDLH